MTERLKVKEMHRDHTSRRDLKLRAKSVKFEASSIQSDSSLTFHLLISHHPVTTTICAHSVLYINSRILFGLPSVHFAKDCIGGKANQQKSLINKIGEETYLESSDQISMCTWQ